MDKKVLETYKFYFTNERLKLIILPTEQCNFRCPYCWEDYQYGRMKRPTINGIKSLLSNRAKTLKLLEIEWFGGEPLLAVDIISEISKHIQELQKKYSSLVYRGSMTTNGYLLDNNIFNELYNLGIIRYCICLDGFAEIHNETRKLANGEGTFDTILNNLLSMKKTNTNFDLIITIHYFKENYLETVKPLITSINKNFMNDNRFKVLFKSIQRLGGKNDCEIKIITSREEQEIQNYLLKFVKDVYIIHKSEYYVCDASALNTMVIRSNGNIGKCIVATKEDCNKVGKINTDGTLDLDNKKYLVWSNGFETENKDFLTCPLKFVKNKII